MDRKELQQAVLEAQAQIQAQAQMALAEKMSSLCFKRCVSAPGDKLADRQRRCLDMCTQSFAEGFGVAVRAVRARAARIHVIYTHPPPTRTYTNPNSQSETIASIAKKQSSAGE